MLNYLYGKPVVDSIIESIKDLTQYPIKKSLVTLRLGNSGNAGAYEKSVVKWCTTFGIPVKSITLQEGIDVDTFRLYLLELENDEKIGGILVLKPMVDTLLDIASELLNKKDLECIGRYNLGGLFKDSPKIFPCTPKAVVEILEYYKIPIYGKKCTIIGSSNTVGKPLSLMLESLGATVSLCNSKTTNLKHETLHSDIVVSSVGIPNFLDYTYFRDNQTLIDVGYSVVNGKAYGDIDVESLHSNQVKVDITPVPKGVGEVTSITLIKQFLTLH